MASVAEGMINQSFPKDLAVHIITITSRTALPHQSTKISMRNTVLRQIGFSCKILLTGNTPREAQKEQTHCDRNLMKQHVHDGRKRFSKDISQQRKTFHHDYHHPHPLGTAEFKKISPSHFLFSRRRFESGPYIVSVWAKHETVVV